MDQSGTYLEKMKKAQEQAKQQSVPAQPQGQPLEVTVGAKPTAGEIYLEKKRKADAVSKFMKEMRAQEAAKAPPEPSMAKAIGSGAQQMALSVPGMFGDIPMGLGSVGSAIPTYAVPYAFEKAGFPFSEETKKGLEGGREKFLSGLSAISPPTTEEYMKAAEPYAKKIFGVGPMYEPQTPAEAIAQTAIGVGGTALMGRPTGAVRRTATGIIGAGTSEGAGQLVESTDYANAAPYVRFGTLAASPLILEKFPMPQASTITSGALRPTAAARKNIAEGVGSFGEKSAVMAHRMSRGKNVSDVAAQMPDRIRDFNQSITGIGRDTGEYQALLERIGKTERTRVFDLARGNPNADSIDISGMGDLQNHPIFQDAEAAARKNAINDPYNQTVMPHTIPAQPSRTLHSPTYGLYTLPATPQQQINGNLSFYQGMKEELDGIIERANSGPNRDWRTAQKAQEIKNRLIDEIDYQVPEYRPALNESRLTYEMVDAPEAGYNFATKYKGLTDYDFKTSFDNYTNDQKNAFRVGFLNRLEESLINGEQGAFNLFIKNPAFQKKVEHVFGPEIAGEIRAKYLSEAMIQRAAKIDQAASSAEAVSKFEKRMGPVTRAIVSGSAATGIAYGAMELANQAFMFDFLKNSGVGPIPAMIGATYVVAKLGGQLALNAAEKRIANKMVQLISNNNPSDYAKINRLIDRNPSLYPKVMTLLEAARTGTELYGMPKEERPAALPAETLDQTYERLVKEGKIQPVRATGGRVGRANGGRIEIQQGVRALMRAMENAKKSVTKSTENLLQMPDEHIAKALDVAKRNI